MKLYAISDLHSNYEENRKALAGMGLHPDDWLILAGDLCEKLDDFCYLLDFFQNKFEQLIWIPGNHELWTHSSDSPQSGARAKYRKLVALCQERSIYTPEDPFPVLQEFGARHMLVPLFLLYDYSFRPDHIALEDAFDWALESKVFCADERFLKCGPFPAKADWCRERLAYSTARIEEALEVLNRHSEPGALPVRLILINHFPLRYEQVRLWSIPRFSLWCGTKATEDWHKKYPADVVVYGHLHIRGTEWRDGVRFEEVSLGYPQHYNRNRPIDSYLREILPGKKKWLRW